MCKRIVARIGGNFKGCLMDTQSSHVSRQFGDYRVVQQTAYGAFGSSYLGEHIHSGTRVHIKVWPARTKQEVEDFLAEARILAPLVHPNIIRVLAYGVEDDHTAFFVT